MKFFTKTITLLGIASGLMLCAPAAKADQATQSFGVTNEVDTLFNLISDPTNAVGILTGTQIKVENYNSVGFYIKGSNSTANASAFTIKLARGVSNGGMPGVTANTRDIESTPFITIVATTPAATGRWCWYTNLSADLVGPATSLGVASITNGTASATFSAFDAGLSKKIVPTRFP